MDIKIYLTDLIKITIKSKFGEDINPSLEIPLEEKFGDFSTNAAMQLTKIFHKNPMEIGEEIINAISDPLIEKIEVIKPGFINFFINKKKFAEITLQKYSNEDFFKQPLDPKNKDIKVIVEHTSVNPNKSMHVGHLRNVVLGDATVRLMKRAGYKVEVQNYIDDTGLQVADTTNAILNLGKIYDPQKQEFDDFCWEVYSEIYALYDARPDLSEKRKEITHSIEEGTNEISKKASEVVEKILECHLKQLQDFGITYDLLVYESDVIKFKLWETAFEKLKKSEHFVLETEGKNKDCWVLKYDGDGGDKVFVRADGTKLYTAKDVAYHLWKFGLIDLNFLYKQKKLEALNYDLWQTSVDGKTNEKFGKANKIINIIDERQSYPQEMVKLALKVLGYEQQAENYNHIAYGLVTLSKDTAEKLGVDVSDGSSSYSMSGRKGIGVKTKDLIRLMTEKIKEEKLKDNSKNVDPQKIANGAIKLYMLKNHYSSPVYFDYSDALSIEGFTGPYLQYSYARAKSILRKAEDIKSKFKVFNPHHELDENEFKLIKTIYEWEDVLKSAEKSFAFSYVAEYLFKLSSEFNSFYHTSNVLNSEENTKLFRLALVEAFSNILKDGLQILGVETLEIM